MIYTSGSIVVCHYLRNDHQTFFIGHTTEIATISLAHNGLSLVSGSPALNDWCSEMKVWDLATNNCIKVLIINIIIMMQ